MSTDAQAVSTQPLLEQAPERFRRDGTALLLVDLQNAFLDDKGSMAQLGLPITRHQAALPKALQLLDTARQSGVQVAFLQLWLRSDYSDAGIIVENFPPLRDLKHCVENSWDAQFVAGIEPQGQDIVVRHTRFSGFHNTDLEAQLSRRGIGTIVVAGFATNAALESTVRSAFERDFHVFVPREATASYTAEMEEASVLNLAFGFAKVVPLETALDALRKASQPAESPAGP
jgi:ureidoacrylate peracid hydrolase